jgi:hypothetical protein
MLDTPYAARNGWLNGKPPQRSTRQSKPHDANGRKFEVHGDAPGKPDTPPSHSTVQGATAEPSQMSGAFSPTYVSRMVELHSASGA